MSPRRLVPRCRMRPVPAACRVAPLTLIAAALVCASVGCASSSWVRRGDDRLEFFGTSDDPLHPGDDASRISASARIEGDDVILRFVASEDAPVHLNYLMDSYVAKTEEGRTVILAKGSFADYPDTVEPPVVDTVTLKLPDRVSTRQIWQILATVNYGLTTIALSRVEPGPLNRRGEPIRPDRRRRADSWPDSAPEHKAPPGESMAQAADNRAPVPATAGAPTTLELASDEAARSASEGIAVSKPMADVGSAAASLGPEATMDLALMVQEMSAGRGGTPVTSGAAHPAVGEATISAPEPIGPTPPSGPMIPVDVELSRPGRLSCTLELHWEGSPRVEAILGGERVTFDVTPGEHHLSFLARVPVYGLTHGRVTLQVTDESRYRLVFEPRLEDTSFNLHVRILDGETLIQETRFMPVMGPQDRLSLPRSLMR